MKKLFFLFLVIFLLSLKTLIFFSSANAQDLPIIYLEWIENPQNSIVINWIGEEGGNRTLEYRIPGNNWDNISASKNPIPGTTNERFKGSLSDLNSGTIYEFRVAGENDIYSFRTAPTDILDPMRFIVAGDIYTNALGSTKQRTIEAFRNMAENSALYEPYFAALGGDLSHAGSDPSAVDLWFEFLKLWQETMITEKGYIIPMVISIGNNEVPDGFGADPEDLKFINSLFSFPKDQWGNSSFNHYGVLDFGDYLSLIILNTNHSNQIKGAQTQWLSNVLSNRRDIDHVFPVYHVAGWPVHRSFRGIHEDAVRNNWHELFRRYDVRVAFEHHDHIFKKTKALGDCSVPVNSRTNCEFDPMGLIYMGGGSWGSPNDREFSNEWYIDKASRDHNFVLVEITDSKRSFTAINESGDSITGFTDYLKISPPEQIESLSISTDSFELKWNEVEGAQRYVVDVAFDENFQNFVSDYNNKNVGKNNSISINELKPNKSYYFRIRSESLFAISDYSNVFEINLKPETPKSLNATDINPTTFIANWEPVSNISEYTISVSTDSTFSTYVNGYNQKGVENLTAIKIEGLEPGTQYFYRVNAVLSSQESEYSNVVSVRTLGLDDKSSGISADLNRVLANSDQQATIVVKLVDENGDPVQDAEIELTQEGGTSSISTVTDNRTDSDGVVRFIITSDTAGEIIYRAFLSNYEIGNGVKIEFQPFLDKAQIGNNFPNPFSSFTRIPLTVPKKMDVHLSIISVLGENIQTLIDENLNSGYYEIEFNPNGIASGVYFIRLVTEDGVSLNKLMYTK